MTDTKAYLDDAKPAGACETLGLSAAREEACAATDASQVETSYTCLDDVKEDAEPSDADSQLLLVELPVGDASEGCTKPRVAVLYEFECEKKLTGVAPSAWSCDDDSAEDDGLQPACDARRGWRDGVGGRGRSCSSRSPRLQSCPSRPSGRRSKLMCGS